MSSNTQTAIPAFIRSEFRSEIPDSAIEVHQLGKFYLVYFPFEELVKVEPIFQDEQEEYLKSKKGQTQLHVFYGEELYLNPEGFCDYIPFSQLNTRAVETILTKLVETDKTCDSLDPETVPKAIFDELEDLSHDLEQVFYRLARPMTINHIPRCVRENIMPWNLPVETLQMFTLGDFHLVYLSYDVMKAKGTLPKWDKGNEPEQGSTELTVFEAGKETPLLVGNGCFIKHIPFEDLDHLRVLKQLQKIVKAGKDLDQADKEGNRLLVESMDNLHCEEMDRFYEMVR